MKINTIYHKPEEVCKERKKDVSRMSFAKDEVYHPFMKEREFVRAMNATKIERMLSKPLVAALSYHREGINVLSRHPRLPIFASGSFDNHVILWNMGSREIIKRFECEHCIKGVVIDTEGNVYVGQKSSVIRLDDGLEYDCKSDVLALDMNDTMNVGTSKGVEVFDLVRRSSKQQIDVEYPSCLGSTPTLTHILGVGGHRGVSLLDARVGKAVHSVEVGSKTNSISFNPRDGHTFVSGNEDFCLYLHDMRYLDTPCGTYRGHANAVVSVDFNPLGSEVISGSFDRTIRIFDINERKSRDVYYNKRMQNVFGVKYSHDSQFIVSGSDDGSIRLWKNCASKKLGSISRREKDALEYSEALKEKYRDVSEINRISRHRFLPKTLKASLRNIHEAHKAAERRAEKHMREKQDGAQA